ncbi:hypothetical protein PVAP13_2NG458203 [Panicum virgatum]|uniref:Uncharacterized protein n=1 Tax=Panicum virgatum TaxID=38727 RepID=A0A8T0VII5_PANVG|nr:hypothetical protein PVAP13_2NG458203 [Panicum virgatum]
MPARSSSAAPRHSQLSPAVREPRLLVGGEEEKQTVRHRRRSARYCALGPVAPPPIRALPAGAAGPRRAAVPRRAARRCSRLAQLAPDAPPSCSQPAGAPHDQRPDAPPLCSRPANAPHALGPRRGAPSLHTPPATDAPHGSAPSPGNRKVKRPSRRRRRGELSWKKNSGQPGCKLRRVQPHSGFATRVRPRDQTLTRTRAWRSCGGLGGGSSRLVDVSPFCDTDSPGTNWDPPI